MRSAPAVDPVVAADGARPIIRTDKLTKVYPGTDFRAVDELDLTVSTGRDLRPARPERRGQDDHGGHAHHPGHPDLGQAFVGRHRRRRPPGAGQAADRRGVADEHARPPAHRVGEPLLSRPAVRDARRRVAAYGGRAARAVPAGPLGKVLGLRPVGRDGAAPDGGPLDLPPARRPLHGRADSGPRSPEPAGPVGHPAAS